MIEIMIDLQGGAKAPLYEKIYKYIRDGIIDGKISRQERLPSTRFLAKHLSVSRSTVEMAYEQLLAEGYIESEPARGYFVCDIRDLYLLEHRKPSAQPVSQMLMREAGEKQKIRYNFSPYAIDTESFPQGLWRKISRDTMNHETDSILMTGDGQGEQELLTAIAQYLYQSRGVNCQPSQIIIGAGNEYLEILLSQILGAGKKVLMEEPTYLQAYHTFMNVGYQVNLIPAECMEQEIHKDRYEDAELLYLMPSHQFPLGRVMPLKVRMEYLRWAMENESRYLLEDDHDSEYRYHGKPIPSLQSMDSYGKVIYMGTFSKSISPALRISYMVLPPVLLDSYHRNCSFYSNTVPRIQQEILCSFMKEGHFGRHLNRMRTIYRGKHDRLMEELKSRDWVKAIQGDNAGLHVLVELNCDRKEKLSLPYEEREKAIAGESPVSSLERRICESAGRKGIEVVGISSFFVNSIMNGENPVLLLGYGGICEEEMREGLDQLEQTIYEVIHG